MGYFSSTSCTSCCRSCRNASVSRMGRFVVVGNRTRSFPHSGYPRSNDWSRSGTSPHHQSLTRSRSRARLLHAKFLPMLAGTSRDVPASWDTFRLPTPFWACWSRSMSFDRRLDPRSTKNPRPRSLAHPSHKPPSNQRTGLGGLGNGPPACEAFHRKMQLWRRDTSTAMKCSSLTHALVDPGTQIFQQHTTAAQFSIHGILTRYRPTFLKIGTQPGAFVKAWIIIPAPHFPLSQLPSQNPQSPMTSDHMTWASSTHSSSRPFTPVAAHRSASLLCSRKICVAKSAIRCRRSTFWPHHSRRRFWVATVLSFVFQLGMTVDPVHNRFAVPHDIWGQFLLFLRYFKLEGRQFPGFLCRPGPICLGLLLHGLFHGPK